MTVNMAGTSDAPGRWQDRVKRIAATAKAASVDVIIAQAVVSSPGGPFESLGRAMPDFIMEHFAPVSSDHDARLGLAMFARRKLSGFRTAPVGSGADDPQPRKLLSATTGNPEQPIHLINCYTSWIEDVADTNVQAILDFLKHLPGPVLLAGDFNQAPASPAMRALEEAGFVDAWTLLREDEPGPTYPNDAPSSRIDYFWLRPELAERARSIKLVGGQGEDALSDHRALVLELAE